jgi:hypothetical protein
MRSVIPILSLIVSLTLAPFLPSAQASVVEKLGLPELVSRSEYVVLAQVESAEARRAGKYIVTDVTLRVTKSLKGSAQPGTTLVATHLGGVVGGVGLSVHGAPHFETGKSAVVFLRRASNGDLHVTGVSQGLMPVETDASTQTTVVQTGVTSRSAALVERNSQGALVDAAKTSEPKRKLDSLLDEITQLVKQASENTSHE